MTDDAIEVQVALANAGDVSADEVVQLNVGFPGKALDRPIRMLRDFRRVNVGAGATTIVRLRAQLGDLGWWSEQRHAFVLEPGEYTVSVGGSSDPATCLTVSVRL